MKGTAEHDFEQRNGLRMLHVEIDYDAQPVRPAVVSGPAELCHPTEGGVEVDAVRVVGMSLYTRDGALLAETPAAGHALHPTIAGMFEAWLEQNVDASVWQGICEEAEDRAEAEVRAMYERYCEDKAVGRRGIC